MSDRYNDVFPTRLRQLIEEMPTTITALARELGISRQAVSQYTMGQGQPNADKLVQIAEYFDVSCDWLVGRQGATRTFETDLPGVCKFLHMDETCVKSLQGLAQYAEKYPGALHWIFANDFFDCVFLDMMQYYTTIEEAKDALKSNDIEKAKTIWQKAQYMDYFSVIESIRDMLLWWNNEDDDLETGFAGFYHSVLGGYSEVEEDEYEEDEQEEGEIDG